MASQTCRVAGQALRTECRNPLAAWAALETRQRECYGTLFWDDCRVLVRPIHGISYFRRGMFSEFRSLLSVLILLFLAD